MSTKDDALKIVTRYFLEPGRALEVEEANDELVILNSSFKSWDVRPIERLGACARSPGYKLYFVEIDAHATVHGIATLPGDRFFHLNDEKELRAFYTEAHALLAPLEVASLLVLFQSPVSSETIVVQIEDLSTFLDKEQLAAHAVAPLSMTDRADGSTGLQFDASFVSHVPGVGFKINLDRWRVEIGPEGQIDWHVEAVARDLDSPFYSPKTSPAGKVR